MNNFLQKKTVRIALIVVAALLIIGLVGGILASMGSKVPASSGTAAKTTVTSAASSSGTSSGSGSSSGSSSSISGSGSSSNSGSSGTGSGSSAGSSASSSMPTQYTLTYLPGEYYDGESHCPEPVTVNSGEEVIINFFTHPTRSGYDFVGWATSDGADNPVYEDMSGYRTITMSSNVTLYPVFHVHSEEEVSGDPDSVSNVSITIDNTSGADVVIMDTDEKEELFTVSTGNSGTYTGYTGDGIRIRIGCSLSSSMSGTYKGTSYLSEGLTSESYDSYDWIQEPTSGQQSFSWYPVSNDSFTITVTTK